MPVWNLITDKSAIWLHKNHSLKLFGIENETSEVRDSDWDVLFIQSKDIGKKLRKYQTLIKPT